MQKAMEFKEALLKLNKNLDELQRKYNNYRGLIAHLSQNMNESLKVLSDKIQSIIEMTYLKNYRLGAFEKISSDVIDEINKLNMGNTELWRLSGMYIELNRSPNNVVKDQHPVKLQNKVEKERSDANV